MLPQRAVSLAAIAWSFGVVALLLRSGLMPTAQPPSTHIPDDPLTLATSVLRASPRFTSATVGYAGMTPNEVLAWRVIFLSPDGQKVFTTLLSTASPAGKLFALAGLRYGDSLAFVRAASQLRAMGGTVQTVRGCLGGPEAIADIVSTIEQGDWTREFIVGTTIPVPPR